MNNIFDLKDFLDRRIIYKHRRLFKDNLGNGKQFIVLVGSSLGCKSYEGAMSILYKSNRFNDFNVIFFSRTEDGARKTGFNQYIQCIENTPEFKNLFTYSKSEAGRGSMHIVSKATGSWIDFKTFTNLDNSVKSNADVSCYVFDEADRFTEDEILNSIRYLRGNPTTVDGKEIKPFIMLMLNPNECWIKDCFFDNKRDDSLVIKTSWRDNTFLSESQKASLEVIKDRYKQYPTNPLYRHNYDIYYLGKWSSSAGMSIFNISRIEEMKSRHQDYFSQKFTISKMATGNTYISNPDPNGYIEIYSKPIPGTVYVCGYDTRDDTSNSQADYGVGVMLDAKTKEIVAIYRQNTLNSVENEEILYSFLKYYNYAWFVPEVNKYAEYLISQMVFKGKYLNYISYKKRYGIYMEKKSKPECINLIQQYIDNPNTLIKSDVMLDELKTYVNSKSLNSKSVGAQFGKHDDTVMALGVALYALDKDLINTSSPRLYDIENNNIINNRNDLNLGASNFGFGETINFGGCKFL